MAVHRYILNNDNCYGWVAVLLHWFMAVAILGLYPLGLYIESLDYYDPAYRTVPMWHKSVGIIVAVFLIVRLIWRVWNKPPRPLPQPKLIQLAAKLTHIFLYLLLFVALCSGFMISTADGSAIAVFNMIEIPALPFSFEHQEDIAGDIHFIVTTLLMVLAAIHAGAALKHHFIDKDPTLKRMLAMREKANED
ncbi:MAG: cytochrome b [Neptuniibacter sp.]